MKPNEINEAIAKHLGWRFKGDPELDAFTKGWSRPEVWAAMPSRDGGGIMERPPTLVFIHGIPNYSGDLNAMHGLEMALEQGEYDRYDDALVDLLTESAPLVNYNGVLIPGRARHQSATAAQRAEAFLRTVGKWKEAE